MVGKIKVTKKKQSIDPFRKYDPFTPSQAPKMSIAPSVGVKTPTSIAPTKVLPKGEVGVTEKREMQKEQIAAMGKTPLMRETTQGDRFDVNKPIVSSDFKNIESFKEAKAFRDLLMPETPGERESSMEEAQETLEEVGAMEEVTPERVELSPEPMSPVSYLPVLGPVADALAAVIAPKIIQGREGQQFDMPLTPETIREESLRQIRDKSFKQGVTFAQKFGSVIEGIPLVGSLSRKYAAGLIETPSANADAVIAEIDKVKEAASTGQEKVRNGLEDPDYGLDRARSMESQVAALEGRLKALINSSPILRANVDEVNRIEEGILEAKEKIARYRQAAALGLTAELTGTGRAIPTDEQMLFELSGGRK